jgi:phosphinothricin acetyltransferase
MPIDVRPAADSDLPAILEIYNDVIATSTAVYTGEATSLAERAAWRAARVNAGYPVLVATDQGTVLGFGSFGDWRSAWPGYRHTIEHTVHVRADRRAHGVGTALMEHLIIEAGKIGKHVMVGAIDADNESSIRFHARLGFAQVAHFRQVGRKFDRWLDLVFMQRMIDPPHGNESHAD